jgi:TetR/AcrR family transcriptional regulator, cholesterol catabolism regulator
MSTTRREQIIRISADLFAQKGYAGTTVREIGNVAGILSGSLYHHFDSKEAIADEILTPYYEGMVDRFRTVANSGRPEPEVLAELILMGYRGIAESPHAVSLITNSGDQLFELERFAHLKKVNEELESIWLRVLRNGIRKGYFKSTIDPRLTWTFIRDALSVTIRWWKPNGKYTIDDIARHYTNMIYGGILAADDGQHARAKER